MKLLIQLFEGDRNAPSNEDRDFAGRCDELHPSVLVTVDLAPDRLSERGLITIDLGVGSAAVADDQRHGDSVPKPWDAA